jgi:capsular polysaccharide biosynthesis protein
MKDPNHSTYTEDDLEIDLRQILTVLKKWRTLIIAMTLLCGLAAAIVSFFILPPIYQAQTLLMVNQATDKLQAVPTSSAEGDDLTNVDNNVSRMPVLTMNTYLGQIKSETLMNRIISDLKIQDQYSAGSLAAVIDAQVVKDSNLIEVKVTGPDPVLAAV